MGAILMELMHEKHGHVVIHQLMINDQHKKWVSSIPGFHCLSGLQGNSL